MVFQWIPEFLPRGKQIFVLLAITAGLTLGIGLPYSAELRKDELARLVGGTRCFEGRLVGGFDYAPYPTPLPNTEALLNRAYKFQRQLDEVPKEQRAAQSARIRLFQGKYNEAVSIMEKLLKEDPRNAIILSDLSVALLERARIDSEPHDSFRALILAADAVEIAPNLPEARFNLALALESMSFFSQAYLQWEKYLTLDQHSQWANEARKRIKSIDVRLTIGGAHYFGNHGDAIENRLSATFVKFPYRLRKYAEEGLLGLWGQLVSNDQQAEAQRVFRVIQIAGERLSVSTGDQMLAATVTAITNAKASDPERFAKLLSGHILFDKGIKLERQDRFSDAASMFRAASEDLRTAKSPFWRWAAVHYASCLYYQPDYSKSLVILESVGRDVDPSAYPALAGRIHWLEGLIYLVTGRFPEALLSHEAALRTFERVKDHRFVGFMHSLIASDLYFGGRYISAWSHRYKAMRLSLHLRRDSRRTYSIFSDAAEATLGEGKCQVALIILDELAARLTSLPPGVEIETHIRRALALACLGKSTIAQQEILRARMLLVHVHDSLFRDRLAADLLLKKAEITLNEDPDSAVKDLTEALHYYVKRDYRLDRISALSLRAKAYERVGRNRDAASDLEAAIEEYERAQAGKANEEQRLEYMSQVRAVIESLLRIHLKSGGDLKTALVYLDRVQRAALSRPGQAVYSSMKFEEMPNSLPADTSILGFYALEESLLIWCLDRHQISVFHEQVTRSELSRMVHELREEALRSRTNMVPSVSLYNILIGRVRPLLGKSKRLVLVPDKFLFDVPFAALFDERRGRFLVEDFSLCVAPSATFFLEATHRSTSFGETRRGLLVMGDNFDRKFFPSLPPLKGLKEESRAILRYKKMDILAGEEATPSNLAGRLAHYDFVHFAGHSVSISPWSSVLALSPELSASGRRSSGLFYSKDIYSLGLRQVRLVVLASCSSASGESESGEASISLVRPFLVAGVPVVMANLWVVQDKASASFFDAFYKNLFSGLRPDDALREVQLKSLATNSDGRSIKWSGFQIYGSANEYF